jgi:hypothetical protein
MKAVGGDCIPPKQSRDYRFAISRLASGLSRPCPERGLDKVETESKCFSKQVANAIRSHRKALIFFALNSRIP